MKTKIKEPVLSQLLANVEQTRKWTPRTIAKLERLMREGEDFDLFTINPVKFGKEHQIEEQESIELFLHAAKHQLFQMNWQLFCPSCGGVIESFNALKNLHTHYNCGMCLLENEAFLDDFITINFTISTKVRDIIFHHPAALSVEDYYYKYHFIGDGKIPGGPRLH